MPRARSLVRRERGSPFWWADFTIFGRRYRKSTKIAAKQEFKAQAELIADHWRRECLTMTVTGAKPKMTLGMAIDRYWGEHGSALAGKANIERQSKMLKDRIGQGVGLHEITAATVSNYASSRCEDMVQGNNGRKGSVPVSNTTVNKDLVLLRAVMNIAAKRWGVQVAEIDWKEQFLEEPPPRDRYLTHEEADKLLAASAPHLRPPIEFSLMTGVRLSNCINLDWSQIDIRARQITFRVKSRKPGGKTHVLPITNAVMSILNAAGIRRSGRVFTYKGRPIKSFRHAWYKALARAGIADCRWHDLRGTSATWMLQSGVPLDVVKDVLGHENIQTTMRYAYRETTAKLKALETLAKSIEAAREDVVEADTGVRKIRGK